MNRAIFGVAALLAMCASLAAQQPPPPQPPPPPGGAPPMQSVLAGKKFTPPIRGAADVDFVKSPTKREGTTLVTRVQVKNTSTAPIPRLKISETWDDKEGGMIPGGEGVINGLLQPGEIQTVEIRTPVNPKMATSMLQFTHANGTVPKPHPVKSFDEPKKDVPTAKKK